VVEEGFEARDNVGAYQAASRPGRVMGAWSLCLTTTGRNAVMSRSLRGFRRKDEQTVCRGVGRGGGGAKSVKGGCGTVGRVMGGYMRNWGKSGQIRAEREFEEPLRRPRCLS